MSARFALLLAFAGLAGAQTFTKDVAPILDKNCVSCHRPGEIAPMSLMSYNEARPWAKSIKNAIALGKMPPWQSEDPRGTFSNDRRLTEQEKQTLIAWVDHGAPQGDPKALPALPKFAEGWQIGKPDAVLSMSKPFHVPAEGTIAYQYFQVPTNFTEDKWVQAIEVRPGAHGLVHHLLVFCREPDGASTPPPFTAVIPKMAGGVLGGGQQSANRGGGQQGGNHGGQQGANRLGALIATTAPGTNAMVFPQGTALLIKAGSVLTFQVHYTAKGTAGDDVSSVGLVFAKHPPEHEMYTSAFLNPFFTLPAGDAAKEVDSEIQFNEDTHIYAIFPHTHLRGKSWAYTLTYPDGRSEQILSVPHYDFNWQTYYVFSKPLAVPKGSTIKGVAVYDNSVNNPANPDPTAAVHWGEQTWQEMQYTGLTYTIDEKAPPATGGGGQR